MALSWSTGIRNFAQSHGSYKRALQGGVLEIFTGSAPATADTAKSGTLLCTVSLGSGAVTKEVMNVATIVLSGSGGTVDSITINGSEILGAVVSYTTDLTETARLVTQQINSYQPVDGPKYFARSNGACINIAQLPGCGTAGSGWACTAAATTMTFASTTALGGTGGYGVAGSNGLTYGGSTAGIMSKSGVWSGVNVATGVAGYFRITGSENDAGTASTTSCRVQGVCGISSGDYPMTTTTLTSGQTHTVDTFLLTLPAA